MCNNKMSDVRLSNASPTVDRSVDARPPDTVSARPSVRRNLFGRPDREEIRKYLEESVQGDVEAFEIQYNFDPVNEKPMSPRNYEWQEDQDAPEFYRREAHGRRKRRKRNNTSDSSGLNSSEMEKKRPKSDNNNEEEEEEETGSEEVTQPDTTEEEEEIQQQVR